MKEEKKAEKLTTFQLVLILAFIGWALQKMGVPQTTICFIGLVLGAFYWAHEEQERRDALEKEKKDEVHTDSKRAQPRSLPKAGR